MYFRYLASVSTNWQKHCSKVRIAANFSPERELPDEYKPPSRGGGRERGGVINEWTRRTILLLQKPDIFQLFSVITIIMRIKGNSRSPDYPSFASRPFTFSPGRRMVLMNRFFLAEVCPP